MPGDKPHGQDLSFHVENILMSCQQVVGLWIMMAHLL